MTEVQNFALKQLAECPCGCQTFGQLLKGTGHTRACPNTCPKCRGKRNREKGKRGERDMRKRTGITTATKMHAAIGEEAWSHPIYRAEAKAGAQVKPIATRFLLAESQSEANRAVGDGRWFLFLARPDGMPGGVVLVRGEVWRTEILPALEAYNGIGGAA